MTDNYKLKRVGKRMRIIQHPGYNGYDYSMPERAEARANYSSVAHFFHLSRIDGHWTSLCGRKFDELTGTNVKSICKQCLKRLLLEKGKNVIT